jgi:hypothetical protein
MFLLCVASEENSIHVSWQLFYLAKSRFQICFEQFRGY